MLMKRIRFDVSIAVPGSTARAGTRTESFLAKSWGLGRVPVLEDVKDGFTLVESPAILSYLADTHGWTDLYPSADDRRQRATVDAYLSWHHRGIREASALCVYHVRTDVQMPDADEVDRRRANAAAALTTIDSAWLREGPYIGGLASPSIADILCYGEVGPLRPMHTGVLDLSPYPALSAWAERMAALPCHDDAHATLATLGPLLVPNEVPMAERLAAATKAGLRAIAEAQAAWE